MNVFLFALAASVATFIGGSFALRFRDQLHLILGFSAGAVAGLALFDLLPEAISLGIAYYSAETLALFVAGGFFGYFILDRLILLHTHEEDDAENIPRGFFGALTLATHSFLDGIAIGIGFQVSSVVGLVVTAAVLTHDFSDGINTVNLILKNGGSWKQAFRWLLIDAAARLLGAECIIVGISARIAQTLVHLGVDLSDVNTGTSLAKGLTLALKATGLKIVRADEGG